MKARVVMDLRFYSGYLKILFNLRTNVHKNQTKSNFSGKA